MMTAWSSAQVADGLTMYVKARRGGIVAIGFGDPQAGADARNDGDPLLLDAVRQLTGYFAGTLRAFDLPLEMEGTEFQKRVWRELLNIPYGATRSYADVAAAIGAPKGVRAVGAANGSNPIAIVVPCHRVVGSGGKLVGYGGGLDLKRRLLDLERGCGLLMAG